MKALRNPTWSRDELILALDVYFRIKPRTPSPSLSEIAQLSRELNRIGEQAQAQRSSNYRSPASVVMKMMNFRSFDDEYAGEGLSAAGRRDREIWDAFANDTPRLRAVAQAIRANQEMQYVAPVEPYGTVEAAEGRLLTTVHFRRERNPRLVEEKKRKVLKETGRLECEVCGFDFLRKYGPRGRGYIECHHIRPLYTLKPNSKTGLNDLALVCANCHRMLHCSRPWPSIAQLKSELVKADQPGAS